MTTAYLCGGYLELYTNRISQNKKGVFLPSFVDNNNTVDNKELYRYQSYHRAREQVKRLLLCNLSNTPKSDIFFTLTYAQNMSDYKQSQKDFNRFRSRCRKVGFDFPYLVISERQKRGAIHHHGVFFGTGKVPIKKLRKLWSHGFIFLEYVNTEKPPLALALYMTKYLSKDFNTSQYKHHKQYRTSYNLSKPLKFSAPTFISRYNLPDNFQVIHKSDYTPLYSEPTQYSLIQLPAQDISLSIFDICELTS